MAYRDKLVHLLVLLVLGFCTACAPRTRVHVTHTGWGDAGGAEVYADGVFKGVTSQDGTLSFDPQMAAGAKLTARLKVFERPSYRQEHGPENGGLGWVERVYVTSLRVNNDGSVTDFTVADPNAVQELTVSDTNTLIGLHFLVSLDWDASQAELDALADKFRNASEFLYNATDGQFLFEQIEIADNSALWASAEYHDNADTTVWPHTTFFGGFLGPVWGGQPTIELSRRTDQGAGDYRVIAHEFGHLGFALMDEYVGINANGNYCTGAILANGTPYSPNQPRASCVMYHQWEAPKFCSGRQENPHRTLNWQIFDNCWNSILGNYNDGIKVPRWILKSPDTRGAIVGTLPGIPAQWRPRINVTNNATPSLCLPIPFTVFSNGTPFSGATVWLRLAAGGQFTEGKTDDNGNITIVGAHDGDQIWTPNYVVPVNPMFCTLTK